MTASEHRLLCDVLHTMTNASTYIRSKQVMNRDGQILYAEDMKALRQLLNEHVPEVYYDNQKADPPSDE